MKKNKLEGSYFIISLDFELYWGIRDKRSLEKYKENIEGVYKVIPKILELFEKYSIHATWATVGFLFSNSIEEILNNIPKSKPNYLNNSLSPYLDIEKNELKKYDERYFLAPSLIDQIRVVDGQEIASHTYSHYYCLERGQTISDFNNDLILARKVAKDSGITLDSIIFPRNQINEAYLEVCMENAFRAYRGNELSILHKSRNEEDLNVVIRLLKFIDSYINISGTHSYPIDKINYEYLFNIRASSFLRPYNRKLAFFEKFKLTRIKKSLQKAAINGEVYHLWWHPHNFGSNQHENLRNLEIILSHFSDLRSRYKMQSMNMAEMVDLIEKK